MPQRSFSGKLETIRHRVATTLTMLLERGAGKRIIAAVSGGVDSMVLVDLLLELRKTFGLEIAVAHFNHKLRVKADLDARFVQRIAARQKLEFFSDSADVAAIAADEHVSLEMAGRASRYAFFRRLLESTSYDAIATAHTRTDNAETVILNLARGGGLNALGGIPPLRALGNKAVVRPLLSLDKPEIIAYAKARGIVWREDETNREISIPRNFVRITMVPEIAQLNPRFAEAIGRTSTIVRDVLQYLRPEIDNAKKKLMSTSMAGHTVSIAIPTVKVYFGFLLSIALHEILRETFPDVLFGAADIDRVLGLVDQQTGVQAHLEGSIIAFRDRGFIKITRDRIAPVGAATLVAGSSIRLGGWMISAREVSRDAVALARTNIREWIDADVAGAKFTVRPWRAGDAFVPLGMSTRKKLSNFLTDKKVPNEDRSGVLVVESPKHIVWVCGHRIDQRVRVTDATVRVLELNIAPVDIER